MAASNETPRLGLAQLVSLQELNAVTWNEALAQLDALVDLCLLGQFVDTPPPSPSDGDAYLIGDAPTGAWSGYSYKIAACLDGAWRFYTPFNGLRAYVTTSGASIVYLGGSWTDWNSLISANEVSVAAAAVCDLGAAGSLFVQITGNTTIASFGTAANKLRYVRFGQALTLTHNAASLILLGAVSRTTAAGDIGVYASDASGNWRERSYFRAARDAGDVATRSGSETLTNKTINVAANTLTLASGGIFVGSSSNAAAAVALSGDATIANTGALTVSKIGGKSVALGGTLTFSGAYGFTATLVNTTTVTFPVGGTLATLAGTETLSNKTIAGPLLMPSDTYSSGIFTTTSSGSDDGRIFVAGGGAASITRGAYFSVSGNQNAVTPGHVLVSGGNNNGCIQMLSGGTGGIGLNVAVTSLRSGSHIEVGGNFEPHAANASNLGSASYCWANGYIQNAWTVVSDANLKEQIAALSDAETATAKQIVPLIVTYKMKAAVAEKGGAAARRHCGWIAQQIAAVFAANGLDPFAYGCVGFDPAVTTVSKTRLVADRDGEAVEEPYDAPEPDLDDRGVQKKIYNIRPDEVMAFALAGLAARVAALEEK